MNILLSIFKTQRKSTRRTVDDYKQEMLVRQGREQFKVLVKKGLSIPVALL